MKRIALSFALACLLLFVVRALGPDNTAVAYPYTTWESVGSARFSAGSVDFTSLVVHNGTPYIAYQDLANSSKATVMKYNGTSWENVGSAGFSAGEASFTSLAVYNGTP